MPLVYDMEVRDLSPQKDPKGGSPKTPIPIAVSELRKQQQQQNKGEVVWTTVEHNGNGVWRAIAGGLGGTLLGMTVAWFTALSGHGVTEKEMQEFVRQSQFDQEKNILNRNEMQEYVKDYSPWVFDKQAVINRMAIQDQQLGALQQKIDLATRVIENQHGLPPSKP